MLEFHEDHATNVAEIEVSGEVTAAELEELMPRFEKFVEDHGRVCLLEEVRGLDGVDLSAIPRDIVYAVRFQHNIVRCAVVGERRWLDWLTKLLSPLTSFELRYFEASQRDAARAWLHEAATPVPPRQRPAV